MAREKRVKMGRPALPPGERRSVYIGLKVTPAEFKRLTAEAKRCGLESVQALIMRPWRGEGR